MNRNTICRWMLCLALILGLSSTWVTAAPSGDPARQYSPEQFQQKMTTFFRMTEILDGLYGDMDQCVSRLKDQKQLSLADEEFLASWLFSYRLTRTALKKLGGEIRKFEAVPREDREKVMTLSFAAFAEWYRMSCYLWKKPNSLKALRKKLNEPVVELDIAAGEANKIMAVLTRDTLRDHLVEGAQDLEKSLTRGDPVLEKMAKRAQESARWVADQAPATWKVHAHLLLKKIGGKLFAKFYKVESAVSVWIGDTKYRPKKPSITHARVQDMKAHLQPGDIMLERENWFLSNLFLPGFWKHGIVYVGTIQDLEALGIVDHPEVAHHLPAYGKADRHGYEKRIIEAISDGVVMGSLEEATDADYICALRPRKSKEQIAQFLVNTFAHVGRPYDFLFDFMTADKIVCTELLYRSFRDMVSLNLKRVAGRWSLPADDILRKFVAERKNPDRDFDFVFFMDSDPKTQVTRFRSEQDLCDSLKRPSADFLLSQEE